MTITIFVGDVTEYLYKIAFAHDSEARLLTHENCEQLLLPGTYFASLGDFFNYKSFVDVLDQADELIYCPPDEWSDIDPHGVSDMRKWTEHCLYYFRHCNKKVQGITFAPPVDAEAILSLADQRRTDDCQLWIAGGSDSHGVGVEKDQRYGELLARSMNLEVSFLTAEGASLEWACDQISRSDLRPGDTVILATVPEYRLPFFHEHRLYHVTAWLYTIKPKFQNLHPMCLLDNDNTTLYRPITAVQRTLKLCENLGVIMVIAGLTGKSQLTFWLSTLQNYVHLHGRFGIDRGEYTLLDLAKDNVHPGTATHAWYAYRILEKIKLLNNA